MKKAGMLCVLFSTWQRMMGVAVYTCVGICAMDLPFLWLQLKTAALISMWTIFSPL